MSIETRHWAWCSLGPLAPRTPATISDGYVQGSGIVATRGTITLAGIYRPVVGAPVSLAYSNGQSWIARVPRRLRVLSSLADPLRGITTVSVGCLLTLHANRKPPAQALTEAEENANVPEVVRRSAALPITAAWVTQKILTALGLTAAGAIPFTIARVVDEWDMTAGYVEELGRIAQSEGYFCWMNEAEQVAFISKDQELSAGPLITRGQIIDLQPVNVGDLPGDAVFSNYTSLKLNPPENLTDQDRSQRNWEREVVIGGGVQSIHSYTNSQGQTVKEFITYNDASVTETIYDGGDRVVSREERSNQLNGVRVSKTRFQYASGFVNRESEDYSRVLKEITEEFTPEGDIAAACGLDAPHAQFLRGNRLTSWRVTEYNRESSSGVTLTKTIAASAYINTPFGADAIAKLREAGEPLQDLIGQASRLVPFGGSVRIRTEREFGLQRRPSQQERNQAALSKAPAVEQTTTAAWLLGSAASETAVELSPPYVSDDVIVATGSPPTYSVVPAPASQQALNYGRIENRLLLANRNGVGLQLAPLDMPAAPFSLFYLRLNGSTAALRTNGTTWTIGENGIVCSTDALLWGAIDGNPSTAWFPLPPGQSTLPAAVAVTTNASPTPANAMAIPAGFNPLAPDLSALFAALPTGTAAVPRQSVNPSIIVRPWREVITLRAGLRVGAKLTERPWIPQTIQLGGGVRVGASLTRVDLAIGTAKAAAVGGGIAIGTIAPIGAAKAEARSYALTMAQGSGGGGGGSTPIPVGSITYSQSTVEGVFVFWDVDEESSTIYPASASNTNMTDGLTSGTATGAEPVDEGDRAFIRMDLGAAYEVGSVVIGTATTSIVGLGGYLGSGGIPAARSFTENRDVRYSTDGTTWTTGFNTGTLASNGIYTFSPSFTARYIEIVGEVWDGSPSSADAYVALTEFYALAPGQTFP